MSSRVLLLDGPTGTELERRGVDTSRPLWSALAIESDSELLVALHREYIEAGADIITANTFRTNRRAVVASGLGAERARTLTHRALELARRARDEAGRREVLIAGSVAPVEDCYSPGIVPGEFELAREHAEMVAWLDDAGADLILVETMNTQREALAATDAACQRGLRTFVSLVVDMNGTHVLDGQPLDDAIRALDRLGPEAILVNCSSPSASVRATEILRDVNIRTGAAWKFGGYPNAGEPHPLHGYRHARTVSLDEFLDAAGRMLDLGADVIGSCCGTTSEHTRRLRELIDHHTTRRRTGDDDEGGNRRHITET